MLKKKKNKTISLRIDEDLLKELDLLSEEKNVTRSELISFLLRSAMENNLTEK